MQTNDKRAFKDAIELAYETARQALPSPAVLTVYWASLEAYPLDAVLRAISKHVAASEFAPTPASILKHLPKESDGQPEADEAWAIALRSRDERDTVVWTNEIAEAWGVAQSVIDGDEIGARMAFKAAYARIVDQSRGVNRPVEWVISQGFDVEQREAVVLQAVREGRLQLSHAQAAVPMLTGPAETSHGVDVEANLTRLKVIVSGFGGAKVTHAASEADRARESAEDVERAKQLIEQSVAAYQASHA